MSLRTWASRLTPRIDLWFLVRPTGRSVEAERCAAGHVEHVRRGEHVAVPQAAATLAGQQPVHVNDAGAVWSRCLALLECAAVTLFAPGAALRWAAPAAELAARARLRLELGYEQGCSWQWASGGLAMGVHKRLPVGQQCVRGSGSWWRRASAPIGAWDLDVCAGAACDGKLSFLQWFVPTAARGTSHVLSRTYARAFVLTPVGASKQLPLERVHIRVCSFAWPTIRAPVGTIQRLRLGQPHVLCCSAWRSPGSASVGPHKWLPVGCAHRLGRCARRTRGNAPVAPRKWLRLGRAHHVPCA